MFKKMYDSLSVGVHVEFLVHDDYACLKIWTPVSEVKRYERGDTPQSADLGNDNTVPGQTSGTNIKSLAFSQLPEYMSFPVDNTGVYHTRLPAGVIYGEEKDGVDFLPNIPASIRSNFTLALTGQLFRNVAYSWIDPTDTSINGGEQSDGACWVIGVVSSDCPRTSPAYNALATTHNTKAHPLRSVRQHGAPASLFLYQPFTTDNFTDCSVTLKYNQGYGFSTNILDGWDTGSGYDYLGQLADAMPHFTVTSGGTTIDEDGYDTVEFKMVDVDGTLIEKDTLL